MKKYRAKWTDLSDEEKLKYIQKALDLEQKRQVASILLLFLLFLFSRNRMIVVLK